MFVLAISTITMAVNYVYVKRGGLDLYGTNKFASISDTVQICNFGSSHGMYGFNYEDLESDFDCFNFAMSSQSLSYDYRLFQHYGDHIVEGTVVFIPVSYFSLFGIDETNKDEFLSKNKRYYFILPSPLIKEYDYKTELYARYFPALTANTGILIMTLLGKSVDINAVNDAYVGADAIAKFNGHIGNRTIYYDDAGNRIENQEEIGALYALIEGCREKGAVPILVTTPHLREYTDIIKEKAPDFYDQFYSIIDRVVRDTGAEYYDYSFDERFVNEYSWFMDTDHLNQEGARNFTNIVMDEIVYAKGYLDK